MTKRIIVLLLIICLTLSGCEAVIQNDSVLGAYSDNDEEQTEEMPMTDITMLYYPDMDTNPLTTDCYANHELLKWVYSPLMRVGDSFRTYNVLASDCKVEGNTVTVTLKDGLKFSDGTALNANDVEKSVDVIRKNPASPYYNQVIRFKKYYASGDLTFICVLDKADVDCMALFDFPIMKNGKEEAGCGPYKFSAENGKPVLTVNENYFAKPNVPLIKLIETKSDNLITSLFSSGELDVISVAGYDDLSLTSLRDYEIVSGPSNNFIYIGINTNDAKLSDAKIRRAISVCIDRNKIATQSLVNLAEATVYPFNPSWYRVKIYNTDVSPVYSDSVIKEAVKVLKDVPLTLTLPKNSDIKTTVANSIAESFKALGLTLTVTELESAEYTAAVTSGNFMLYLGETAVARDMDPTFLYKTGGSMNYTGYSNENLDALFDKYKTGDTGLDSYLTAFSDSMPIIPIVFRKNVMYCAKGISGYSQLSPWNSLGDMTTLKLN